MPPISDTNLSVGQFAERYRREEEEIQRWIKERCALAVKQWRAAHPWIADPGLCVSVPVRRLFLPDENL